MMKTCNDRQHEKQKIQIGWNQSQGTLYTVRAVYVDLRKLIQRLVVDVADITTDTYMYKDK